MSVSASIYQNFLYNALHAKNIDFDSDTIKATLHTSTYSPDLATHAFQDSLTNEVTGTGYDAGGKTLAGCSVAIVVAASAPSWATATAYTLGQLVRKTTTNAHIYRCVVAGTSHAATEPTWPTDPGITVTDGTVTWAECGSAYIKLTFTAPSWTTSTITARYMAIADTTPGSAATNPLIALVNFGADQTTTGATFTVTPDATYGLIQIPLL